MRTTKAQVYGVISELLKTAIEFGILEQGDRVKVQAGNSSYRVNWNVQVQRAGASAFEFPGVNLHGCCSRNDAWLNLTAALRMLQAARDWTWESK
jgi:hypothetical protein